MFLEIQYKIDSEADVTKQTFYLEFNHVKFQAQNIVCFWDKCLNEPPMSVNITRWSEELNETVLSFLYLDCLLVLMYMTHQKCSSGLLNDFSRMPTITQAFWTQAIMISWDWHFMGKGTWLYTWPIKLSNAAVFEKCWIMGLYRLCNTLL